MRIAKALDEVTLVDRAADPSPNADDSLDRIHVHFGASHADAPALGECMTKLAGALAADAAALEARPHLPDAYDNAKPAPPAPKVDHDVPAERALVAVLELAFASPHAAQFLRV